MSAVLIDNIQESHLFDLWKIVGGCSGYFDDMMGIRSFDDFLRWYRDKVIDGLVGVVGGVVVICGYIDAVHNGMGRINIVMRRKSVPLDRVIEILRDGIEVFIKRHGLKMLYGVVRENNKACLYLLKRVKFKITDTLYNLEIVNQKVHNCYLVTYIPGCST